MRIGVVSNTQGPSAAEALAAAADMLIACRAEVILHCGDVGGRQSLEALARYDAAFIWGDRDRDRMDLIRQANRLKLDCYGMLGDLELDGKLIALCHGDDPAIKKRILDEQQYDYLLTGHAPTREDRKVGRTRLISPGSLDTPADRTVALIDLTSAEVAFLSLDPSKA